MKVRRLNWIGHINRLDDTIKVEQVFGSQPDGVRTRGRSRSGSVGSAFGQVLRTEELRIGGKQLGIGMNIRRQLRRRMYTSENRGS